MKPLVVTFILTITFPGEESKRFEQVIAATDAIPACLAMATAIFRNSDKDTADGRTQTVECKASR